MRYLRNSPTTRENYEAAVLSTALAVGIGIVVFYFTRLILAREPIGTTVAQPGEPQHGAP